MNEVKTALDAPEFTELCERDNATNNDEWQEWYGCAIRAEHFALFSDNDSLRSDRTYDSNEHDEKGCPNTHT